MRIIIGSTALKYHGMYLQRPYKLDLDVWSTEDKIVGSQGDHLKMPLDILEMVDHVDGYATVQSVLTIKMSHLQWDIFWEKTISDVLELLGRGFTPDYSLYKKLVEFWRGYHGKKEFLSLDKSKEDFFTDGVEYIYDHDQLHAIVASPYKPLYTKCLKDGADVMIDRDKFFMMMFDEQVKMFQEEIMVITFERLIIPRLTRGEKPPTIFWAYHWALKRTITRLTKNWASDFIIMNLEYIIQAPLLKMYDTLQLIHTEIRGVKYIIQGFGDLIDAYGESMIPPIGIPKDGDNALYGAVTVIHVDSNPMYSRVVVEDKNGMLFKLDGYTYYGETNLWHSTQRVEKKTKVITEFK